MIKERKEHSGLHCFNRENGLHILFDEIQFKESEISKSPRTVSIALTNRCNLNCKYCYAIKNNIDIPYDFLKDLIIELDLLGTLELTFGGGEPLLYPRLIELIGWIWKNTNLGINITTNGLLLTEEITKEITGKISSIRFSIDGLEDKYKEAKKRDLNQLLKNIEHIQGQIPFGINAIVNHNGIKDLIDVIELAIKIKAMDVLIIPEHNNGIYVLSRNDWVLLKEIFETYKNKIQLNLTYNASKHLNLNYLSTESEKEFLFAHISADKKLKTHSYKRTGINIENTKSIANYFSIINN